MKKFLFQKVMVSRFTIGLFGLLLLTSMTLGVIGFVKTSDLQQNLQIAQKTAFLSNIDFKGQDYAPVNLSEMPDFMKMEVAAQLPQSAFVKK